MAYERNTTIQKHLHILLHLVTQDYVHLYDEKVKNCNFISFYAHLDLKKKIGKMSYLI